MGGPARGVLAVVLAACASACAREGLHDYPRDTGAPRADAADMPVAEPRPSDSGPDDVQRCIERTTRVRPQLPDLVGAYPDQTYPAVTGDGNVLAVAYVSQAGADMHFALADAATGEALSHWRTDSREGVVPFAVRRRDDDQWEVLRGSGYDSGVFGAIDLWSETSGFVGSREIAQSPRRYTFTTTPIAVDGGFVWPTAVDPDRTGSQGPPFLLAISEGATREVPIPLPELPSSAYAQAYSLARHGTGGVAGLTYIESYTTGQRAHFAFAIDDVLGEAPRVGAMVEIARVSSSASLALTLHESSEGLVLARVYEMDRADLELEYTWLDAALATIATWRTPIPGTARWPSVGIVPRGVAGRFPHQALVAEVADYPSGSLLLAVAARAGEVTGGITAVANGTSTFGFSGGVWESSPRGYSYAYWRGGLEIVTFRCEEEAP